jgi:hypothetical protein
MSAGWPMVPLGEVLREERQRVGAIDADGLPLLGVSNITGLHRSSKERRAHSVIAITPGYADLVLHLGLVEQEA